MRVQKVQSEPHRRDSSRRRRGVRSRKKSRLAPPPPLPLAAVLFTWSPSADRPIRRARMVRTDPAAVTPDPCTFSLLRAQRLSRSCRAPPLIGRHAPPLIGRRAPSPLIGRRALTAQACVARFRAPNRSTECNGVLPSLENVSTANSECDSIETRVHNAPEKMLRLSRSYCYRFDGAYSLYSMAYNGRDVFTPYLNDR